MFIFGHLVLDINQFLSKGVSFARSSRAFRLSVIKRDSLGTYFKLIQI